MHFLSNILVQSLRQPCLLLKQKFAALRFACNRLLNICAIGVQESQVMWIDFGVSRIVPGLTRRHPAAVQEQQLLRGLLGVPSS